MPKNEGSYGVKSPWNKGTSTENMVYEPTFMAYKLRLLWHTNPDFYAIWAVFIGRGWSSICWGLDSWVPAMIFLCRFGCFRVLQCNFLSKKVACLGDVSAGLSTRREKDKRKTLIGGVPTTPDPNTTAEVSKYKKMGSILRYNLVVYVRPSAKRRAYFCKNIAIETGGVSRYFSKALGSGVDLILLKWFLVPRKHSPSCASNNAKSCVLFQVCIFLKKPRVHKCFSRKSGAGNGCANFMGHKILRFRGRGDLGSFWESADFIFMGTGIFLSFRDAKDPLSPYR